MNRQKSGLATKSGAAALALSLLAGNTAAAMCAGPHEMAALRAAALRQHLMVAALTCHETSYFNRFVTEYRAAFVESDHELLRFFVRAGSGEDGYNAYKTKEANDSSLSSMHDPSFCGGAEAAFEVALHDNLPLEVLATQEAPMLHTGFEGCSRSADATPYGLPSGPAGESDESTQPMTAVALQDDANAPEATYGNAWYPPAPMRQVQGADGRWYLVPPYYR